MLIKPTYLDALLDNRYYPIRNETREGLVQYLKDNSSRRSSASNG